MSHLSFTVLKAGMNTAIEGENVVAVTLDLQGVEHSVTLHFAPQSFIDFVTYLVDSGTEVRAQYEAQVAAERGDG